MTFIIEIFFLVDVIEDISDTYVELQGLIFALCNIFNLIFLS